MANVNPDSYLGYVRPDGGWQNFDHPILKKWENDQIMGWGSPETYDFLISNNFNSVEDLGGTSNPNYLIVGPEGPSEPNEPSGSDFPSCWPECDGHVTAPLTGPTGAFTGPTGYDIIIDDGSELGGNPTEINNKQALMMEQNLPTVKNVFRGNSLAEEFSTFADGSWTVWVKPTAVTGKVETIMSFGSSTADEYMLLGFNNGKLEMEVKDNWKWTSTKTLTQLGFDTSSSGKWSFIAVVQNATYPAIYVDGENVTDDGTITGSNPTAWHQAFGYGSMDGNRLDKFTLGAKTTTSDENHYKGHIDELSVWHHPLSALEVQRIWNSTNDDSSEPGLSWGGNTTHNLMNMHTTVSPKPKPSAWYQMGDTLSDSKAPATSWLADELASSGTYGASLVMESSSPSSTESHPEIQLTAPWT